MSSSPQHPAPSTREFAISLFRQEFKRATDAIPEDVWAMTQDELEVHRKPTDVDYLLRKRIWDLVGKGERGFISDISSTDVYKGICSKQAFHQALAVPMRVAWFLTPMHPDHELMEAGVKIGLRNLMRFISKEPDQFTIGAFIRALELLLNRTHGPVVQRIDARHAHLNMNKPVVANGSSDPNARLEELKARLASPVDVTPRTPE